MPRTQMEIREEVCPETGLENSFGWRVYNRFRLDIYLLPAYRRDDLLAIITKHNFKRPYRNAGGHQR